MNKVNNIEKIIPRNPIDRIIEEAFEGGQLKVANELESLIKSVVIAEKEVKAMKDAITSKLKSQMDKNGVKKIETNTILLNYIEETEREIFDKKKFQEEHEELYNQYIKFSKVKPSIRMKLK